MEPNEPQELQENAEHAEHDKKLRPVALTMTVLAVLVAVTAVLGHRTHTDAVLQQDKATDTWNEYQAHKIRAYDTELANNLLGAITIADKSAKEKLSTKYEEYKAKSEKQQEQDKKAAEALETKVEEAEVRANHFDMAEALLEIGLVITSITLLTRKRLYWYVGMAFSAAGAVKAAPVLFQMGWEFAHSIHGVTDFLQRIFA